MHIRRKVTASLTAVVLAFSLGGCGDDGDEEGGTDNGATQEDGGLGY